MINSVTSLLRVLWNVVFNILSVTKTPLGALVVILLLITLTIMIFRKRKRN